MFSRLQAARAEEKLGFILRRIGAIRTRINSLAWQKLIFGPLACLIAAVALVMLAAYYLPPLAFLVSIAVLGVCLITAEFHTVRTALGMRVNSATAASIADLRAGLKGRLETIVQLGGAQGAGTSAADESGPLWPYLVEDTLGHQDEFEPARIERRRVSRSLYGLLGSLVLAALILPLIARARAHAAPRAGGQGEVTLDLNSLHLRRAGPGSDPGVELQADAQTMRRLEEKMAREGSGASASNQVEKLLDRARQFAGNLQNKLTGRSVQRAPLRLKLADASSARSGMGKPGLSAPNPTPGRSENGEQLKPGSKGHGAAAASPELSSSTQAREGSADYGNPSGHGASQKADSGGQNGDSGNGPADQANGLRRGNGGASHGAGTAADTLFGSAAKPKPGSQGFEISIEARPMPRESKGDGHAYIPPTVQAPLNPDQHPDEPVARASVPEEDRVAIKRVFER